MKTKIVKKVWGEEHWIVNKDYCGKMMILKKDYQCSLHYHKKKDEVFYVIEGKILFELNGKERIMKPGDSIHIKPFSKHRFTGLKKSRFIEFSSYHDEKDSYRIEPSRKVK